ncbi:hypothetical protein D3C78_1128820 [compost metagenome]
MEKVPFGFRICCVMNFSVGELNFFGGIAAEVTPIAIERPNVVTANTPSNDLYFIRRARMM